MTDGEELFIRSDGHSPRVLLIHLLDRCNLRCRHCYLESSTERHTFLPVKLVEHCLEEAEALGIEAVYFSGGEPFLYPGFPEIFGDSLAEGAYTVTVSTNGTCIDRSAAARLRGQNITAQVSIDGPEEYHDRFRDHPGAFRQAAKGIAALARVGVPIAIVTTVTRSNLNLLPQVAKWAVEMGVSRMIVQPMMLMGRGAGVRDERLSDEQLCELLLMTSDFGYHYRSQGLAFGLAYRSRRFLEEHPCAAYVCDSRRCHRRINQEIKTLVVREDGTVLPEIPTLHRRFAIGNLKAAPLSEMLIRYYAEGYDSFRDFCRAVYREVVPTWTAPLVPWDEILSLCSHSVGVGETRKSELWSA
jgi:MoaA/NifB/PqqE/SkfB family radical SAM enzyme